jgi:cell division inhibitor SepF
MSMWKRAMDYLGLGDDDAYDDYDIEPEPEPRPRAARPAGDRGRAPLDESDHRMAPVRATPQGRDDSVSRRFPLPASDDSGVQPRPISGPRQGSAVRAVPAAPATGEPSTVRPRRFDQAQEVADKFKQGQPVIMNIEGADREVSRRLIDFASGLCYGLNGSMEKVATGVYLLKPHSARMADEWRSDDADLRY